MTASEPRHQLLALSGGGHRGVFTAAFLARCEAEWSVAWPSRFQLFAGTSVGALLAAGLAAGRSAAELVDAMRRHGPLIFPARRFASLRRFVGPAPYETEPLRAAVEEVLGAQKDVNLNAFAGPLVVTAVNYSTGRTEVLTSAGLAGSAASDMKLVEAVLASAAAPTYLPLVRIGRYDYADGGLVANAPDLVAYVEAVGRQRPDPERTYMLSVGTAGWSDGAALHQATGRPGVVGSLFGRRLVQTTMAAQEDLALRQIRVLMRDRHLRVDREPDRRRTAEIREMDNASLLAFEALTQTADEAWRTWQDAQRLQADHRLRDFFAR